MAPNFVHYPLTTELGYGQDLRRFLMLQGKYIREEMEANLGLILDQYDTTRQDAMADWYAGVTRMFDVVAAKSSEILRRFQPFIGRAAQRTDKSNRDQWLRLMKRKYGITFTKPEPWLVSLLETWERENLRIIDKRAAETRGKLHGVFTQLIQRGTTRSDLSATLTERLGVDSRYAASMSRDQIGTLNAQLSERRQQEAFVREYIWRTMRDEKVRHTHRENDGKKFRWDKPPATGHPGWEPNCRCIPEPVFLDLEQLFGKAA